jgi:hypothetical protein
MQVDLMFDCKRRELPERAASGLKTASQFDGTDLDATGVLKRADMLID